MILARSLKVQPVTEGKALGQEYEAAACISSTGKRYMRVLG